MDAQAPRNPNQRPAPERLGPRPLPLYLGALMTNSLVSRAALASWKSGSLAWNPALADEAENLRRRTEAIPLEALAQAVEAESQARVASFLEGVEAYRAHPYRRDLPEPPSVWQEGTTRLLDYGIGHRGAGAGWPLLVVPSLVNRAYILDLTENRSLMRSLAAAGFHPYLVDWDGPGAEEKDFTLTDYVAGRLEAILDFTLSRHGKPPALIGYCMGGNLALALAHRRQKDVAALALLATPWDFQADRESQARLMMAVKAQAAAAIEFLGELPVDLLQTLFWALDPDLVTRKFRAFAAMDPASDAAREFVALEDWLNDGVALAANVARECLFKWYGENATSLGRWRIAAREVKPEELGIPALVLVPEKDRIVPPAAAIPLARRLPNAQLGRIQAGHIGMVTGSNAKELLYAPLIRWVKDNLDL